VSGGVEHDLVRRDRDGRRDTKADREETHDSEGSAQHVSNRSHGTAPFVGASYGDVEVLRIT
jgi:hypothetical protein